MCSHVHNMYVKKNSNNINNKEMIFAKIVTLLQPPQQRNIITLVADEKNTYVCEIPVSCYIHDIHLNVCVFIRFDSSVRTGTVPVRLSFGIHRNVS